MKKFLCVLLAALLVIGCTSAMADEKIKLQIYGQYADDDTKVPYDYAVEKLKWFEYGAEPTFLLTEEMSEEFKDSKVDNAFATELESWIDDVVAISEEFNKKLSFTGNCTITGHEYVAPSVVKVTYSNGNSIYINYNKEQVTVDDVTVKPVDYTVVESAGGEIVG